ncbi:hypothetical protein [Streptomyces sp. 7N604]|uniref:hypothetical protein n=1 Tax=Streptomyces sp. 7N604 TaxID=3457415 RepID=UPI003FD3A385
MVLCPAREKCTAGLLAVFRPLMDGRLPMHRHETFGTPCPGAHKKPTTPPLKLRLAPPAAEEHAPEDPAERGERTAAAEKMTGGEQT